MKERLIRSWPELCNLEVRNTGGRKVDVVRSSDSAPINIIGRDLEVIYKDKAIRGRIIESLYQRYAPSILITMVDVAVSQAIDFQRAPEFQWKQNDESQVLEFICWGDRNKIPRVEKDGQIYLECMRAPLGITRFKAWIRNPGDHLTFDVLRDRRFDNPRNLNLSPEKEPDLRPAAERFGKKR